MEGATNTIGTTLSNALTTVAGDVTSAIGDVLPIALGVMGVMMVITIGVGLFRKFSKKN